MIARCERCRERETGWHYRFDRESKTWVAERKEGGPLCKECARVRMPRPGRDYD